MANLSITASGVLLISGSVYNGTAGVTITAGQPCYLHTDGTLKLALAGGTAAEAAVYGVSLHAALAGQPLCLVLAGIYGVGATVVVGGMYALSATAGLICPIADIINPNYVSALGVAVTAARIELKINNSGIVRA